MLLPVYAVANGKFRKPFELGKYIACFIFKLTICEQEKWRRIFRYDNEFKIVDMEKKEKNKKKKK